MTRLRTASTLALAAAATLAAAPWAIAAPAARAPFPYCSWWTETTPETMNVALPDTSATYWTTPLRAVPGTRITLSGRYPRARYASVNVYDNSFGVFSVRGVPSGLADYRIAPDPGGANPWRRPRGVGDRWTLTLRRGPAGANTLPIAPAVPRRGTLPPLVGFVVYRVYLPAGRVPLPSVTVTSRTGSVTLPACDAARARRAARRAGPGLGWAGDREAAAARLGAAAPMGDAAAYPMLQFFRPQAATTNSLFPNTDNAYIAAMIDPTASPVVVVRGLAPSSPSGVRGGDVPVPWPQPRFQVRYWSACNNVYVKPYPVVANPGPDGTVYGCAADRDTVLDAQGRYTYVISSAADRPANATAAAGVTWLPFSASEPTATHALVLRNMLPTRGFGQAIQAVPQDGTPASAATAMGAYYPQVAACTTQAFEAGGADACLAGG